MGHNYLEAQVPVELTLEILKLSPDLESLFSFATVSSQIYQVFQLHRVGILNHVVRRVIGYEVFHEAVFLAEVMQFSPGTLDRKLAFDSMESYKQTPRTFSWAKKFDLSILVELCRFHHVVTYHVDALSTKALRSMKGCAQALNLGKATHQTNSAPLQRLKRVPLSNTETARLRRALYRTELFGILFYKRPNPSSQINSIQSHEQESHFLARFSPWEVEEMMCVWHYLQHQLGKCFDDLEDEFVRRIKEYGFSSIKDEMKAPDKALEKQARKVYLDVNKLYKPIEPEGIEINVLFNPDGPFGFFSRQSKFCRHESLFMEVLSCLGVEFLHDLFKADIKRQMRMVLSHVNLPWQPTFIKAHNIYCTKIVARVTEWPQEEQEETMSDEHLDLPNAGYGWARACFAHEVGSYPCRHKGGLRSLGYVFWDNERLTASRIFEHP